MPACWLIIVKMEAILMRIYTRESSSTAGKPTYEFLLHWLKERGIRGATVLKACCGYGSHGQFRYEGVEVLSHDLPVVVEVVDLREKLEPLIPQIASLIKESLITVERAKIE